MNFFIDNALIRKVNENKDNLLFIKETCLRTSMVQENEKWGVCLTWPSFLEYCQLGALYSSVSIFGDQNKFSDLIIETLSSKFDKELLFALFDQIFVECLTQVKDLSVVQQPFLLNQIKKKRDGFSSTEKELFEFSLNHFENSLIAQPYQTLHDLILYLAWDRVCFNLSIVFENQSTNIDFINGVKTLKDCLVESFLHIFSEGKTSPSFFSLIEALYSFHMREEYIQSYSEPDWMVLCQSSQALRLRDHLPGVPYVDEALKNQSLKVLTLDSIEKINATQILAKYVIKLLEKETGWSGHLSGRRILSFYERDSKLSFDAVCNL